MRALAIAIGLTSLVTAASAADFPIAAPSPQWNWSGSYIGVHSGAVFSSDTRFADPFGSPIYGDRAGTPGWLFGGQIGHNWQAANSPWVLGVEAQISGMDSDGTVTCFAVSGAAIATNCRVQPEVSGTLTGRVGYAVGPQGRTLLYAKGGLAWTYGRIEMAIGNAQTLPPGSTAEDLPPIVSNDSRYTMWGGTIGAGIEYAMTPAWSLVFEYDYMAFASTNVANLGNFYANRNGDIFAATPESAAGVTQDLHRFKLGLNYKWGADPWAAWPAAAVAGAAPVKMPVYKGPALAAWTAGWEVEIGGRYVGHRSTFQDDLGRTRPSGTSPISLVSRLTYEATDSDSGEIFGRIDTPWNWFIKGFYGRGKIHDGRMNDEDFGITQGTTGIGQGPSFIPYTNTLHPKVDGDTKYATIDVGYDWWRARTYKLGAFVGYNYYEQNMSAHGCDQIANEQATNCILPRTLSDIVITQDTKWKSLRVGVAGEFMPHERIKLGAEVAYLPFVRFNGLDRHLFSNTEVASINPDNGYGNGVQLEGVVSFLATQNFSLGVGGRYWAMWTDATSEATRTLSCTAPGVCGAANSPPQFMKGAIEQASLFVQASYRFDTAQ
jgi:opacity protein-like surface antigen